MVGNAVGSALRIQNLQIKHAVHANLDVVARDTDLLGNVHCLFLQGMSVADHVQKWNEDVESGVESSAVFAEAFHDVRALLGNHDGSLGNDNNDENRQEESND